MSSKPDFHEKIRKKFFGSWWVKYFLEYIALLNFYDMELMVWPCIWYIYVGIGMNQVRRIDI
jgi:hypothetical protein